MIILILAGTLWIGAGAFSWWTWRTLWRRGRDPWSHWVYDLGVRQLGLPAGVLMALVTAVVQVRSESAPLWSVETIIGLMSGCIIGLPGGLWAGYWWGRIMAGFFGIERPLNRS